MIDGWRTQTAFRPQDIVYDLQMAGVAGIIHVDIDRRLADASTALALTMEMKANVVIPIYSSGTVHGLEDISRLRHPPNIHGAVIGEALIIGLTEPRSPMTSCPSANSRNNNREPLSSVEVHAGHEHCY